MLDTQAILLDARGVMHRSIEAGSAVSVRGLMQLKTWEIERAIVYHALARYYSPVEGNRQLLDEVADKLALVPAWVLLPHWTEELPAAAELVETMVAGGVYVAILDSRLLYAVLLTLASTASTAPLAS